MLRSRSVLLAILSVLLLTSCTAKEMQDLGDKAKNSVQQDRELDYNRDDYRRAMAPRPMDDKPDSLSGKIPDLAPVISEDKKNILPQPLVSITVNQDVPLRDIFFELAQQAEVDLELDPTISGSIIFTAYNRPFDQVVERIADMAGLRFKFKNNVLRVERDTPYMKTYKVDYLSSSRTYTSTIQSNTSAASGSGSGGGGSNGSSSTISNTSTTDFWTEFEANITQIIANTNQQTSLTDQSTPITTPQAIPAVSTEQLAAVAPPAANGTTPAPAAGTAPTAQVAQAAAIAAASQPPTTVSPTAPTPGLLNPTGTQTVAGTTAGGTGGAATVTVANPYFSVNRQAGLVNVFATEKQHEKIAAYITELRKSVGTQVLIEAKIFEVELNDESSTGIDWTALADNGDINLDINLPRAAFPSNAVTSSTAGIFTYNGGDLDFIVNAIGRFGTIRTLSSPRLTVMNNQTAVLNVSESRVFFEFEIERTEGTANNPPRTDITTEINNVPEGVIMTVHPSVDQDTGEITMNLRPSITRIVRTVSDPGAAIASGGTIENLIPELSVREIDSIVKMHSGATVIMGGLMQDRTDSTQVGIPVLGEAPIIGPLFRNQRDQVKKTEMVIMLRAKVVDEAKPDQTDKDLYKNMSQDRRPFKL